MGRVITLFSSTLGDVQMPSPNAGGSVATLNTSGDIQVVGQTNPQLSSAGISPGATGADNILAVFTLPANFFGQAGNGINITAQGNCPNTNAKTIKIIINPTAPVVGQTVSGGTTIASLTATGANTQGGWQLEANVFKTGVAGSNTQVALHQSSQVASTLGSLVAPSALTLTESATIPIAITGNATTAVGDITINFLEIFAVN